MATIDRIRSSGNTPDAPINLSPLQAVQVNSAGPQARNESDVLVQSLSKFSSGLATFRDAQIKRTKDTQVRQAALLAELNKGLPDNYYREGVQQYDTTRGAIQGRALSSQLLLANQSLMKQAERDGGSVQDKQLRYMDLLDNFRDMKNAEVRGASTEFLTGMNAHINQTRTQMEVGYVNKLNKDFENEQTTTLRSSVDLLVDDRVNAPRKATVDRNGKVVSLDKFEPIKLQDYKNFMEIGKNTTKFTKEQLRGIWLERLIEIATTGVDGEGEPIPEVLEHVFTPDKDGFKLVFDSEFGAAAQKGLQDAKKAYVTYHTSRTKAANKATAALQEKTKADFMGSMTKAFINGDHIDARGRIAQALEDGSLKSTAASVLLTLNKDYIADRYPGDVLKFDILMTRIQTLDPEITMESLQMDYITDSANKEGINPTQFVKLQSAYNTLTGREASNYRTAVSDIKSSLNGLLRAGTENKIASNENKKRKKKGFDELNKSMVKIHRQITESGLSPNSPEFAAQFRSLMAPIVDFLGEAHKPIGIYDTSEEYREVQDQLKAKHKARTP
jgi:hypothetical protein